jgi:hypothetical protein
MGGVRRAVVKIYHGRNIDHRRDVWRITQEEGDIRDTRRAHLTGTVT